MIPTPGPGVRGCPHPPKSAGIARGAAGSFSAWRGWEGNLQSPSASSGHTTPAEPGTPAWERCRGRGMGTIPAHPAVPLVPGSLSGFSPEGREANAEALNGVYVGGRMYTQVCSPGYGGVKNFCSEAPATTRGIHGVGARGPWLFLRCPFPPAMGWPQRLYREPHAATRDLRVRSANEEMHSLILSDSTCDLMAAGHWGGGFPQPLPAAGRCPLPPGPQGHPLLSLP